MAEKPEGMDEAIDAWIEKDGGKDIDGPLKPLGEMARGDEDPAPDETPEAPKPEEKPEEKPAEPAPAAAEKPEEPTAEERTADAEAAAALNETLKNIERAAEKLASKVEAEKPDAPAEPSDLEKLREHADPEVRAAAEELIKQRDAVNARLERVEKKMEADAEKARIDDADRQITAATTKYKLTDAEIEATVAWFEADPRRGAIHSFEDGVKFNFPEKAVLTKADPNHDPPKPKGEERPRVQVKSQQEPHSTVVDRSAAAGARPKPQRAPEGETTEEAVNRGFDQLMASGGHR